MTVTVTNEDEPGRVTFWRDGADATTAAIVVGDMLTGLAEDPDGNVGDMFPIAMYTMITAANVTSWQWAKSMTPDMMDSWMDIGTGGMYTVMDDDDGYYLRATAMYTDGHGSGKMASDEDDNWYGNHRRGACLGDGDPVGVDGCPDDGCTQVDRHNYGGRDGPGRRRNGRVLAVVQDHDAGHDGQLDGHRRRNRRRLHGDGRRHGLLPAGDGDVHRRARHRKAMDVLGCRP